MNAKYGAAPLLFDSGCRSALHGQEHTFLDDPSGARTTGHFLNLTDPAYA